jgi:hypothetical protein
VKTNAIEVAYLKMNAMAFTSNLILDAASLRKRILLSEEITVQVIILCVG